MTVNEFLKLTDKELEPYIADLKAKLLKGTISERKRFIRLFIKKITLNFPTTEIEFAILINQEKKLLKEVLKINDTGCPE